MKPATCNGCPCLPWQGFMHTPQPLGKYNVLLIGEALGEDEAASGSPFVGRAGFLLDKLIRHAGLDRAGFGVANAVWCRPPDNKLSGMPYEHQAVFECRERHLLPLLRSYGVRRPVLVPMGAVALSSLLGWKDIIDRRGYVWDYPQGLVYPTVHPSYIMRGNGNYGTVFIHDLQRAVELARDGWTPAQTHYILDPTPEGAMAWADAYLAALGADPSLFLAYDIETPYHDEEKEEGGLEDDDTSNIILRVSFSFREHTALTIPWNGAYRGAIARILGSRGAKVVWNDAFDTPRIRAAGVPIHGPIHDGMVAWHVLESDLPKKLGFVASMLLDDQIPWKHLNKLSPQYYSAADADVEHRLIHKIFARLHEAGMWGIYDRHILQLTPILARLSSRGMPVDPVRRAEYAALLAARQTRCLQELVDAVPLAARRIAIVYKKTPKDITGLQSRSVSRVVKVCAACGFVNPGRHHLRTLRRPTSKRPQNPCAGAVVIEQSRPVEEYYRLAEFRPSLTQLGTYCQLKKINPIRRRTPDGYKVTFDENAIRQLVLRHPQDQLFPKILAYREVDKIAGTYIGRPNVTSTSEATV